MSITNCAYLRDQHPDRHRPQYHFLSPDNWMNDPNGLIQWDGTYHLFYQYNPNAPYHGTIHWGHAASRDLVHWEDWPIALSPTPGGPDEEGCFSGCAVDHDGVPTLMYTGIRPEVQCIATSEDGLRSWQKHPDNPVIGAPPHEAIAGLVTTGFRDPFVWRETDGWYCVVGSGIEDEGGALFLYHSQDLAGWEYVHTLCTGEIEETGTMWECPNFFAMGDRHVLIISPIPLRKAIYAVGVYEDHVFTPVRWDVVDDGNCFYAPQVMLDEKGRRLMWGWLWEGRSDAAAEAAGWQGVMSLPRVLSLDENDRLHFSLPDEVETLRGEHSRFARTLASGAVEVVEGVSGQALEIDAAFDVAGATACGVQVRRSADGAEYTAVRYDVDEARLEIDRRQSSDSRAAERDVQGVSLSLAEGERLSLRILVDHSVLEVFANGRRCLSSRIYPQAQSDRVALFAEGGWIQVDVDIWQMASIWPAGPRVS